MAFLEVLLKFMFPLLLIKDENVQNLLININFRAILRILKHVYKIRVSDKIAGIENRIFDCRF